MYFLGHVNAAAGHEDWVWFCVPVLSFEPNVHVPFGHDGLLHAVVHDFVQLVAPPVLLAGEENPELHAVHELPAPEPFK